MVNRSFLVLTLAVSVAGGAMAQGSGLDAVLAAAGEESSPVIKQSLETAKGAEVRIQYRAYRFDRRITEALNTNAEIRAHCNENYLWKLAETQSNANIYSEGISIAPGKHWFGFITTGYDWYVVVTNEKGQRIVEELAPVEESGVWAPRLIISVEPGDLSNDAVLLVRYGSKIVRFSLSIGEPVSQGGGSGSR